MQNMNEIYLVRGDTLILTLKDIKMADGTKYILTDTDIVYLDVKKFKTDRTPIIQKSVVKDDYVDDGLQFVFLPSDTVNLPVTEYFFDVRLFIDADNIYTIVPLSKLHIVQNITDIPNGGGG